jgi:hypothetical protein
VAGYSGTPLPRKLGIPERGRAAILDAPRGFLKSLGQWPRELERGATLAGELDYVHLFVDRRALLEELLPRAKRTLNKAGKLWVSWPKQASGKATDLNETIVRALGLAAGLVDVKVCAVDDTWSGLKFVYRLKDR